MNYDGPYRIEERTCGVPRGGGLWPGSYRHWWVVVNARGGAESFERTREAAEAARQIKERRTEP